MGVLTAALPTEATDHRKPAHPEEGIE